MVVNGTLRFHTILCQHLYKHMRMERMRLKEAIKLVQCFFLKILIRSLLYADFRVSKDNIGMVMHSRLKYDADIHILFINLFHFAQLVPLKFMSL